MVLSYKTQRMLGWLLLFLSAAVFVWVSSDTYSRYRSIKHNDQQFFFGSYSADSGINGKATLKATIDTHLFGVKPAVKKAEKPKVVVNAPKTKLNLKLTGVFGLTADDGGYAVIEIKRGESTVVGVGQDIGKTGAKLHDIKSDHILINHRGKIEKLQIERPEMQFSDVTKLSQETIKQLNLNTEELATLTQANNAATIVVQQTAAGVAAQSAQQQLQQQQLQQQLQQQQLQQQRRKQQQAEQGSNTPTLPAGIENL